MNHLFVHHVELPSGGRGHLWLENGKIKAVGTDLSPPPGVPVEDGHGWLALPGAIDPHVHFRQPGGEHKETLLTGSAAALKGGVTTAADMPNTNPHTTTLAHVEQKAALSQGAGVNLLFNLGAEPGSLEQLPLAAAHPQVKALKIYLGPSTGTGGVKADFADEVFALAARLNKPVMVHAEDPEIIRQQSALHPHDVFHHHLIRSLEAELSAVTRALELAARHGTRLYLCHITSAQAVALAQAHPARDRVMVEACPHHLLLSVEGMADPVPNRFKVNPPLRPEALRAELWSKLAAGIDVLGSDHAPHTLAEKEQPYDLAPSGMPGVEYLLPLALNEWAQGTFSLERLMDLTSGNAARFLGLNKGKLAPGFDADLVLVDTHRRWRVGEDGDRPASLCGWTPYQGRVIRGRVERTLVGGVIVYRAPA
ncbi:MAG: dihydroorotase family protein [Deltaproteobacteria bacterium]|nr:dihydroorotase family protein [Deltaproteobacteria bacterium]